MEDINIMASLIYNFPHMFSRKAFTLVELIVVITILAILAMIAFLSFSGYASSARDSERLSDVTSINKGLGLLQVKSGECPLPEQITGTGKIGSIDVSYVGTIGSNLASRINISTPPKDPLTNQLSYRYGVTWNKKFYQIGVTLEDGSSISFGSPFFQTAYAADSTNMARVVGNYRGLLTFNSGSELWVANVPSLIFSFSGNVTNDLLDSDKTIYVADKGTNVPYVLNATSSINIKTGNQVLVDLTGTSATLKAIKIPSTIPEFDAQSGAIGTQLAYGASVVGQAVFGDKYLVAHPMDSTMCIDSTTPTEEKYFTFSGAIQAITDYSVTGPKDVVIPCRIGGVLVKKIGVNGINGAFQNKGLTSVIVSNSVTDIALNAFRSNSLTSIVLGSGLVSIGNTAFRANLLTNVSIPAGVVTVGNFTFADNLLTSVTIPSSVTSIGNSAFYNNKLTSITIPSSITSMTYTAFRSNPLTSVTNPDGVTSSEYIVLSNGTLVGYFGSSTTLSIPSSIGSIPVRSIGAYVFSGKSVTSVTIPSGITSIGANAFSNNQLTSVTIPDSVTSIGNGAFYANQLTSVTLSNNTASIEGIAFQSNQLASVVIPSSITSMAHNAFQSNPLTSVTNPDGVTSSEYIVLSNGTLVRYFGSHAAAIIPSSIGTISVDRIGDYAFDGKALTSVDIQGEITLIGTGAFQSNQLTSITIPSSVRFMGTAAFNINKLTSVIIPDGITSIETLAFQGNQLTSVTIPNSVVSIGNRSFQFNRLTSVTIPNSVTSISADAFTVQTNSVGGGTIYGPQAIKDTYYTSSYFDLTKLSNYIIQ